MRERAAWARWGLSLVALAALAAAQVGALYHRDQVGQILLAYAVALVALGAAFTLAPGIPPPSPALPLLRPDARPRWPLVGLAAGLAGLAWLTLGGNRFTLPGVVGWLGALAAWLAALWRWEGAVGRTKWAGLRRRLASREAVALALLLLVALFARLYRLDGVPPEMNSDHVEKLLDVYDVLQGRYPIFFERNTGREPMQFYLVATIIRLFDTGLTFYSLKLSNLVMGMLAVVGVYGFGREVGGHRLGWLAGFFASVALWSVAPGRVGLRYPFAPAWTALSLWALWRALRTGQRNDWLLAGLALGAGLHGYTAFRIMPLAAVLTVLLHTLTWSPASREAWRRLGINSVLYGLTALLVFWPLARYMADRPEVFWFRALTRSTSLESPITVPLWQLAGQTMLRTFGLFHWVGDRVFVSTIANRPVLDAISSAFFVIGLLYVLLVLVRQRRFTALALLMNGVLLMLPSALNFAFPLESPSVVRTGGAIPIVAVIFALGVWYMWQRLAEGGQGSLGRAARVLLVGGLLAGMAIINYNRYFGVYLREYREISMNTAEVAATARDYLSLVGDTDHILLKASPHWLDSRAVGLQLGDVEWVETNASLDLEPLLDAAPTDGQPLLFLLHPEDRVSLRTLKRRYPDGFSVLYQSVAPGHDYLAYVVPPTRILTTPSRWDPAQGARGPLSP